MTNLLAFVTNPYRVVDDINSDVRAKFTENARIVNLTTNLDESGALRRLREELEAGDTTRVFELTIEKLFLPDDFIGSPPRFAIYSPADNLNGEVFTAFEVSSVNFLTGTSTLRVR